MDIETAVHELTSHVQKLHAIAELSAYVPRLQQILAEMHEQVERTKDADGDRLIVFSDGTTDRVPRDWSEERVADYINEREAQLELNKAIDQFIAEHGYDPTDGRSEFFRWV